MFAATRSRASWIQMRASSHVCRRGAHRAARGLLKNTAAGEAPARPTALNSFFAET